MISQYYKILYLIINFTIKTMLTRKSPFKARPILKKKKLSQLFEEHSTDPDQNYLFKATNGTIKLPNDQEEPAYQEEEQ